LTEVFLAAHRRKQNRANDVKKRQSCHAPAPAADAHTFQTSEPP
jgi:hypothetical protein